MTCQRRALSVAEASKPYGAFSGSDDAERIARGLIGEEAQEVVIAILVDVRLRVLGFVEVSRGGQDFAKVDPRVLFRAALLAGAGTLILAHNHPSGDPTPSPEDDTLTKSVAAAGRLIGIDVLDHLIVGAERSFCYAHERPGCLR